MNSYLYEVTVWDELNTVIIKPPFRGLNKTTYKSFKEVLNNNIINTGINYVIIDIENILELDNQGIAIIFYAWRITCNNNGKLVLCSLTPKILQILKKKKLDNFIKICNTFEEALEAVGQYVNVKQNYQERSNKLEDFFGNLFEDTINTFFPKKDPSKLDDKIKPQKFDINIQPVIKESHPAPEETIYHNELIKNTVKSKIMIVDPNEKFCITLSNLLKKQGLDTIYFTSPVIALKHMENHLIDVIIADTGLPEVSGFEFCSKVKSKFKSVYFIFVSNNKAIGTKIRCFQLGANDYIAKPFHSGELIARVLSGTKIIKTLKYMYFKNSKLEKLVATDPLTNLNNRRYFHDQIIKEITRAKRYKNTVALAILDIDYFKSINDKYGHIVGDEILKRVSSLLKNSTRKSDIICRFGGEEFVVILPESDTEQAYIAAEKIRHVFEKTTFIFSNIKINITVSIGISIKSPDMEINSIELVDMADKALYLAKKSGRNRVMLYGLKKNYNNFSKDLNNTHNISTTTKLT